MQKGPSRELPQPFVELTINTMGSKEKKREVYDSGCPLNRARASDWPRGERKVKNINGRRKRLDVCKYCMVKMQTDEVGVLSLLVVRDHNTSYNSGDDDQQKDEKTETDPSLFAGSSCRRYCLVRGPNPGDDVNDGEGGF